VGTAGLVVEHHAQFVLAVQSLHCWCTAHSAVDLDIMHCEDEMKGALHESTLEVSLQYPPEAPLGGPHQTQPGSSVQIWQL